MSARARRAFLEIRGGGAPFRRVVLAPGERLRVGRTSLADLAIPEDEHLSQIHWEIAWDGARGEVRDLGGAGGLLVGGEPRAQAELHRSGTWLRAGRTDFRLYFEDTSEAPPGSDAAESALARLHREAERGELFAVLDAARSDRILRLLQTAADDHDSLYQGLTAQTMAEGAPYLVRLTADSRLLPRLVREGWGRSFGTYVASRVSLRELRGHFRRYLIVSREQDDLPMYFRFYDPRVLRAFLPLATPRQVELFFGPVDRFFAEAAGGDGIHVFARQAEGLVEDSGDAQARTDG